MNWMEWAANSAFLLMPPVTCAWGWWLWIRRDQSLPTPRWRQISTVINLIALTVSIFLGAFALEYWRSFPGSPPGPPEPTRVTTFLGFGLAVFGIVFSLLAKSRNRVALLLCSLGLLGFYAGMFLAR